MTFRAHEYFDRENGLMVIGSEADLHDLASQLGQAPEYSHNNWPRCVARVNIGTDTDPYNLSFHIETNTAIPKANVPRSSKAFWVLFAMAPLSLVGLFTVCRWFLHEF